MYAKFYSMTPVCNFVMLQLFICNSPGKALEGINGDIRIMWGNEQHVPMRSPVIEGYVIITISLEDKFACLLIY